MKKSLLILAALLAFPLASYAQNGAAGTVVNQAITCATSTDGSMTGILNPLNVTIVSPVFSGTLPAGNYFTKYTWYDYTGKETLASPEITTQLTATGGLTVAIPASGLPSGAAGMRIYIGATAGSETLQGQTAGTQSFAQSIPLVSGAALPQTNTTPCFVVANDAMLPTGTAYGVSMTTPAGNTIPGYPTLWQIMGPGTKIDISNGYPTYHGITLFPFPIIASPLNHATQSIFGSLSLNGYTGYFGKIGIGTNSPGFPLDVGGAMNTGTGYLFNGTAPATDCLLSNGTFFIAQACVATKVQSGTASNSDSTGRVTLSGGSGTFSFTGTYATAPDCFCADVTDATQACSVSESTTALTFTGHSTDVVKYGCFFRN